MKKNKIAASLIEALVVIVILAMGIVATYSFFARSIAFLDGLNMRIEAIEIAREGIEAVENIRNTNWLLFPVEKDKCWNVLGYKSECILDNSNSIEKIPGADKNNPKTYILENNNGRWNLKSPTLISTQNLIYTNSDFRNKFAVGKDNLGKYCQPIGSGCDKLTKGNYTRKIQVYKDGSNDKMIVKSTVEWVDSSTSGSRKVEIYNLLTNYKE